MGGRPPSAHCSSGSAEQTLFKEREKSVFVNMWRSLAFKYYARNHNGYFKRSAKMRY